MPKRSWIVLLVGWANITLWSVLSLLRASPNSALVRYLGYENYDRLASESPALADYSEAIIRLYALSGVALAILSLVVILIPYRQGARWAWAALWVLPAANLAGYVSDLYAFRDAPSDTGTLGVLFLVNAVVTSAGLLMGARTALSLSIPRATRQPVAGTLTVLVLAVLLAACGGDAVASTEEYCASVVRLEERGAEIFADVDENDVEANRAAHAQMLEAIQDEGVVPPTEVAEDYEGFLAGFRGQAEGQEPTPDQAAAEERLLAWEAEHCQAGG